MKVGVANGFLDKVKDVGSEKLAKILYAFPDISPKWLLTGKGEMLRHTEEKEDSRQRRRLMQCQQANRRDQASIQSHWVA